VLEMAMRGFGQIADLCAIASPHVGVVTNIAPVHLEQVGSLEGVARAKAELIQALPPEGAAVVPADAPLLEPWLRETAARVVRFGRGGDVRLEEFDADGDGARLTLRVEGEPVELAVPLAARYQAANVLAAVAAYYALGLPLDGLAEGAPAIRLTRWRGEELELPGGGLLINDCYNANPISMRAALEHQRDRAGDRRRVAVLGEMAELGADGPQYHREIGALAAELGVGALLAVGGADARLYLERAEAVPKTRWVANAQEAAAAAREVIGPGDCVLVKGSRAVGLEAVVEALTPVRLR
jgi:UDP-N-acetylmuramoyl-tripeptide--D-alanyl-D-alanine ligase